MKCPGMWRAIGNLGMSQASRTCERVEKGPLQSQQVEAWVQSDKHVSCNPCGRNDYTGGKQVNQNEEHQLTILPYSGL